MIDHKDLLTCQEGGQIGDEEAKHTETAESSQPDGPGREGTEQGGTGGRGGAVRLQISDFAGDYSVQFESVHPRMVLGVVTIEEEESRESSIIEERVQPT